MPKRPREDPCHICGHWHDYENGEPCAVCGHTLTQAQQVPATSSSAFPSEILPRFLYLGSYDDASRCELLKAQAITHILNTVPTCQNLYKNSFKYHTAQTSLPDYAECFAFLESVKQEGGRVLVHCMTGVSRSPSVVIAYLMRLRQWRLSESHKWVQDRRPIVSVQQGEAVRLQELEVQLHGSSSTHLTTTTTALPAEQKVSSDPRESVMGEIELNGSSAVHCAAGQTSLPWTAENQFSLANQPHAQQNTSPAFVGNHFSLGQQTAPSPSTHVFGKT